MIKEKESPQPPRKVRNWGNRKNNLYVKRNFSKIAPNIAFPEFNFYELYYSTFEKSELGRIKKLLPLREMAENFGLVRKSMRPKLGRRSFFTPEGKVALMFLKMYTGLSCPKLLEQLNGNIHYQIFCDVIIDPTRPLTNYKLLDYIMMELAGKLKIQQLQGILADKWRPYMENLDTMHTDAMCYESEMRYPTDAKLLWAGIEKSYATMCELSGKRGAVGGQDRTNGAFGGCLTLKLAVNTELLWGELYPRHEKRTKNLDETTGNRYKIEILMSQTQKFKGLSAASLVLKTSNDNPQLDLELSYFL